jgi:hypothetical protein
MAEGTEADPMTSVPLELALSEPLLCNAELNLEAAAKRLSARPRLDTLVHT